FILLPTWAWFYLKKNKRIHLALVSIITVFLSSSLFVAGFILEEKQEKKELYEYDLDGNGSFSNEEMTPEAREAMDRWTSDAGRMFVPIVAPMLSIFWITLNFGTFAIFTRKQRAEPDDGING
ncbi:hypothetical protein N9Z14_08190, partial [Opitutales bacterium]|nr:hypothetical protein [Opitutales bacterium]